MGTPAPLRAERITQALALAVIYSVLGLHCAHIALISDPDLGWHLRTAEWMVEHHAVPHVDSFSSLAEAKPWAAYTWLFDLLIFQVYQRWGLVGILAYTCSMMLAVAVALHHMIRRLQSDFHTAVMLTLIACIGIEHAYSPRPWWFSILFFVWEIDILMNARRTGKFRELLYLPVIFAVWANIHVQFVDGLILLGLAWADSLLPYRHTVTVVRLPPASLGLILVVSVISACANPYTWHIYETAYALAAQPGVLKTISEMHAMAFRDLPDFIILFLALAAAAALAKSRRLVSFETAALAFAAVVSFRSLRDSWVTATVASAIVAAGLKNEDMVPHRLSSATAAAIGLTSCCIVGLGFPLIHVTNARLRLDQAKDLPVHAVEVVKRRGYGGPLFNHYDWGGFLIWELRLPVSIDGRTSLHGDKQIDRSNATWIAAPDWASDPQLESANLVIGSVDAPLTQILRMAPNFELVFEDKLAAVFVRRQSIDNCPTAPNPKPLKGAGTSLKF